MIVVRGSDLRLEEIAAVANGAKAALSDDPAILERIARSRGVITAALDNGEQIYGVTTLFGGMADKRVSREQLVDLQRLSLWTHKTSTGPLLSRADVRAAMLLRANSLMKGVSGIRLEIIERYITFLNAGATPQVHQRGSIGASGDLVPLAYIAGAILGLAPDFKVEMDGQTLDSHTALERLGLKPIELEPKEGLALNNGTGACTGVAANCIDTSLDLFALALGAHALFFQALLATNQSFAPFIHRNKAHPGQIWTAEAMTGLLEGSSLIRTEAAGDRSHREGKLIQDRYSLRCMPQYTGPIVDALALAARQIQVESNSANDNPLIDPDTGQVFHTGNFLAQYTAVAMDSLRFQLGMLAKHLDVQIALLVTTEFSYGLPPSLVGNPEGLNLGLKSLQITGNSMAPLLGFFGQTMTDRYPTHAEQYNQNINSQAMNAANLARESVDLFIHYVAMALLFGVQAVELRSMAVSGSHDPRPLLSPASRALYEAVRRAAGGEPSAERPMLWNDLDTFVQPKLEGVVGTIKIRALAVDALGPLRLDLRAFCALD